jgi:diacylglycerol kinase family enzyme
VSDQRRLGARHRLSAIAALVLVPAGVLVLVLAVARGMPGLLLPVALFVVSLYAAWKSIVRRGIRRRIYAAGAALAFVAAVVAVVVVGVELALLVVGVVLLAVGVVLAGVAVSWLHRPEGRLVGPARHPVLIVNPRSGDGAAQRHGVIDEARRRGIRVIELGEGDDLKAIARRAARRGADCLGMAGGDGSLAAVAEEAMAAHIPFVCVPAGTRNHFALDLGLDRSDPLAALDAFGEAFQRRIDVASANGRTFLNNVSIGAYGEVVADEQYRERKIGTALERIPDLVGPESEPLELHFTDGDGGAHDTAIVIQVSNNSYVVTPRPGFGSRPTLSDGCLGVVVVVPTDGALTGDAPKVVQWEAPAFQVDAPARIAVGIDGEAEELDTPARFTIRPDALRVRIPRDLAGVSPAAKRPPLTIETARRLVSVARGTAENGHREGT